MEQTNPELLKELIHYQMPFGKFKGRKLVNLPVSYLEWFARKGFPDGKLGMLLNTIYVIRINGLMDIVYRMQELDKGSNLKQQ